MSVRNKIFNENGEKSFLTEVLYFALHQRNLSLQLRVTGYEFQLILKLTIKIFDFKKFIVFFKVITQLLLKLLYIFNKKKK